MHLLIAIIRKKKILHKVPSFDSLCFFGFFLADETGPAEESKRTKRVQGWSRQILNFGFWDCICNFCESLVKFYD